ncbi:unnamed protein product [Didymodactylos carnosus]|uniref:Histone-lysine N-methyltransferase n=1 Tax=Didymodactylos carnosus TaxID=1234261 RepID=A0A813X8C2_9BILA|nr:unnamed protein product [Didymodactylos carnosus]CAF3659433.1 unnamed protein product [Didymodactylos carnosus]
MDENQKKIMLKIKLGSANDGLHEESSLSSNYASANDVKISSLNNMDKNATSMTENQQAPNTRSPSNVPQMAGWFRLMETVRKTNTRPTLAANPFQNRIKSFGNSNNSNHTSDSPLAVATNTNTPKHNHFSENSSSPCAASTQNNSQMYNLDLLLSPLSNMSTKSHVQPVRLGDEEHSLKEVAENYKNTNIWTEDDDEQQQQPLVNNNITNPLLPVEQEATICQKSESISNEAEQQEILLPSNSSTDSKLNTPLSSAAPTLISPNVIELVQKSTEKQNAAENESNKKSNNVQSELSQAKTDKIGNVIQEKTYKKKKKIIIKKSSKVNPSLLVSKKKQEEKQEDSDDELLIDIRNRKTEPDPQQTRKGNSTPQVSVEYPRMDEKVLPAATDLNSLPGHINGKTHRDCDSDQQEIVTRFLSYNDIETLIDHVRILHIDDEAKYSVKFLREKQPIFKSRTKGLTGIVRGKAVNQNVFQKMNKSKLFRNVLKNDMDLKTILWSDIQDIEIITTTETPLSSFTASWPNNLNTKKRTTKSSSSSSPISKNLFQILQSQRLKTFAIKPNKKLKTSPSTVGKETSLNQGTSESQQHLLIQRMKDFYFQTYGRKLYTAITKYEQFGMKPKFSSPHLIQNTSEQSVAIQTDTSLVVEEEQKEQIAVTPLPCQRRPKKQQKVIETTATADRPLSPSIKEISYDDFFSSTPSLSTKQQRSKKGTEKSKHQRTSRSSSIERCLKKHENHQRKPSLTCMSTTAVQKDITDSTVSPHCNEASLLPLKKRLLQKNEIENDENKTVNERRMSIEIEESTPFIIKESIVLLAPTSVQTRNRRISVTSTNSSVTTVQSTSRKRRLSSSIEPQSPTKMETTPKTNNDESVDEILLDELPKKRYIKNGMLSNYYKKSDQNKETKSMFHTPSSKSKRIPDSSSCLPSLYNLIVRGEKIQYLDYHLPYDVYWTWKRQNKNNQETQKVSKPSTEIVEKKKVPSVKKTSNYKKILKNLYSDPTIRQSLLTNYTSETSPICECKSPSNCADEHCLNRMIFTECTSQSCPCGPACTNQKIRKYEWSKNVEVYDTKKYGLGLRSAMDLPKGAFLCEYVGEIITNDEFLNRMNSKYLNDQHHYTMKLSQNLVIDAYRMGNIARFANHSCQPNCEFQKWTVDGLQRMCMFTLRNIKKNEELTYDYNFQCFNEDNQQKCYCANEKCRKIIGAKPSLLHSISTSSSSSTSTQDRTMAAITQKLTRHDKRLIKHFSVFLMRNLVKVNQIKQKKQLKLQQQVKSESSMIITNEQQLFQSYCFCYQNYYHQQKTVVIQNGATAAPSSILSSLRKKSDKLISTIKHKDMFHLFYNFIRRTHFIKSGRGYEALIDDHCFYAQLAQLTHILNDILRLLMCYKCAKDDIFPAIALKKCPSKKLYPMYYEIIKKPMDLTIIKTTLDNGEYLCFKQFESDLLLLFNNAVTYCGADSDVGFAVVELQDYYNRILLPLYKPVTDLFKSLNQSYQQYSFSSFTTSFANVSTFEDFLARFHKSEIMYGQIRNNLYHLIYDIELQAETLSTDNEHSPVVFKTFNHNSTSSHQKSRPNKQTTITPSSLSSFQSQLQKIKRNLNDDDEYIIHCQCGTVHDEGLFIQCYACQLWQHASCVSVDVVNPSSPYFCFECNPTCEYDISKCQLTQVNIPLQEKTSDELADVECYTSLTRDDGFIVRTNECYYVVKQKRGSGENKSDEHKHPIYDIIYVERLYVSKSNEKYACGFYYIHPYETFHEPNRKFFHNEVFRSPANDSFPLNIIVRQCFVVDQATYCKGKPICDCYLNINDIYICEYRVDKLARTFHRLPKARQMSINTKSYCFDQYIEKLTIKRDYLPHQKEFHQDKQKKVLSNSNKLTPKQFEEKLTRLDGIVEKIYCRCHNKTWLAEDNLTIEQIMEQPHQDETLTIKPLVHTQQPVNEVYKPIRSRKKRPVTTTKNTHETAHRNEPAVQLINGKRRITSLSSSDCDENEQIVQIAEHKPQNTPKSKNNKKKKISSTISKRCNRKKQRKETSLLNDTTGMPIDTIIDIVTLLDDLIEQIPPSLA